MTVALEIEFLTGRCVASRRDDRTATEWPPHPTRLFSALSAAFFECDFGDAERAALEWLEQQSPPTISAPRVSVRTGAASFVPVNPGEKEANEQYIKRKKITIFPKIDEGIDFRRNRQMRRFPTALPETSIVVYRWDNVGNAQGEQHQPALERLAQNLTYLGHSSSIVRAGLCESPPEPTWRPAEDGELPEATLRVPSPGRLASLRGAYDLSLRANRRIEPPEGAFRGYVLAAHHRQPDVVRGVFDERLIVFQRMTGPALPLHASLKLTSTVRKALMDLADEPVPEVLSGHAPIGGRSDQPHVAAIPLPNVGSRYSTGLLTGFALVLPTALFAAERREERVAVLKAIGRLQRVRLDSGRIWQIERVTAESTYRALQPTRYTQASRRWASITPVVFGCFPKSLESKEAKEMVCQHCGMIGLPEPQRVEIMNVSPIFGVPPASHFPTLSTAGKPVDILFEKGRNRLPKMPQKQAQPRVRAHVLVEFRESVFGPILLGAGRYLGMGLCLPVPQLRVMRSEP